MDEASDVTEATSGTPGDEASGIESRQLAERAPLFQAAADRLRDDLERSDPALDDA
ncbi:hypothetical protein [Agromyces sp. LHK192]|uniref:hypothetical protein n=1 Tax=Agromyces sp. LHK192 TaxID=2498704 RepID=UPI0013E31A06|nr:hypothetical protein [Agromyces sp. LHK192]